MNPEMDVLVVDDDEAIRGLLTAALRRKGLTCQSATDGIDALDHCRNTRFKVVLTDLMMPRLDGAGLVERLAALEGDSEERPVILIMTAFPERHPAEPRSSEIAHAIIRKPFDLLELAELVRCCVEARTRVRDSLGPDEASASTRSLPSRNAGSGDAS